MSRHSVIEGLYAWLVIVSVTALFNIHDLLSAFMTGILVCLAYLPAYDMLQQGTAAVGHRLRLKLGAIGFTMALAALYLLGDEARGNAMLAAILGYAAARPARLMLGSYLLARS